MKHKWTNSQNLAIETKGDVIVSASAGSGKTTVMVERIVRALQMEENRIDSVLVLSFNKAIAAEMKLKITNELFSVIKESKDAELRNRLRNQIDRLNFAEICTLDSFCTNLLKTNFQAAGVDPAFTVLDETERKPYFDRAMKETLDEYYSVDDDDFMLLNEKLGFVGNDDRLAQLIGEIYSRIAIQPDGDVYLEKLRTLNSSGDNLRASLKILYNRYTDCFSEISELANMLLKKVDKDETPAFYDRIIEIAYRADTLKGAPDFYEMINIASRMEKFAELREKNIDIDDKAAEEYLKTKLKAAVDGISVFAGADFNMQNIACAKSIQKLLEITEVFKNNFSQIKLADNKLDFADIENYACKLLCDDSVKKSVSQKYKLIFVDEYQDINPTQEYIIERLSSGDNVFTVGDVKQSIYGFRLADSSIFLNRYHKGKNGEGTALELNDNFRSLSSILYFINSIFAQIMTEKSCGLDYLKTAMFTQNNLKIEREDSFNMDVSINLFYNEKQNKSEISRPSVYSVKNHIVEVEDEVLLARSEGEFIADKIIELVDESTIVYMEANEKKVRKIGYGDIAIIGRSRPALDKITAVLESRGIPLNTGSLSAEKYEVEKQTLINLVKVIDNRAQDIVFTGFLQGFFGGFSAQELADIKLFGADKSMYMCALKVAEGDTLLSEKIRKKLLWLDNMRELASYKDVFNLLNDIVSASGYEAFVLKEMAGKERYSAMKQFLHSLDGKSFAVSPHRFVEYIDGLEKEPRTSIASSNGFSDSVLISTIHASKGLEFPVVFVPSLEKPFNMSSYSSNVNVDGEIGLGIKYFDENNREIAPSLINEAIKIKSTAAAVREEMRLLYVAVTRAKSKLYLVGGEEKSFASYPKMVSESKKFTDFLWCAVNADPTLKEFVSLKPISSFKVRAIDSPKVIFNEPSAVYYKEISDILNYKYKYARAMETEQKLSVSAINRATENPDSYIKSVFSEENAERGTAYHAVMENIDYTLASVNAVKAAIEDMVNTGILTQKQANMVSEEEIFGCISCDFFKSHLQDIWYRELPFMLSLPAKEVSDCPTNDNVLVQGTIDLLIIGKQSAVIDFKNSSKNGEELLKTYEKQLYLYKMAAETSFGIKIDTLALFSFKNGALYYLKN